MANKNKEILEFLEPRRKVFSLFQQFNGQSWTSQRRNRVQ